MRSWCKFLRTYQSTSGEGLGKQRSIDQPAASVASAVGGGGMEPCTVAASKPSPPPFISPPCSHGTLPRVCRRWQEWATSPELLQELDITLRRAYVTPRLASLSDFLAQHAAGNLRRLVLILDGYPSDDGADHGLLASLAACSAGGQLTDLDVEVYTDDPFRLSSPLWAAAFATLRRLRLNTMSGCLELAVSLAPLTALERLEVSGQPAMLLPSARLPASLTALTMDCSAYSGSLPNQVGVGWAVAGCDAQTFLLQSCVLRGPSLQRKTPSPDQLSLHATTVQLTALTQLQCLHLEKTPCPGSRYALLTQLRSLKTLELVVGWHIPACLSQLTQLEALLLYTPIMGAAARAAAEMEGAIHALGWLQQLTRLEVKTTAALPASGLEQIVASLAQLQQLGLTSRQASGASLPAGPALATLRCLHLEATIEARSLPALSAATRLLRLVLRPAEDADMRPLAELYRAVLRWAPWQPELEQLVLGISHRVAHWDVVSVAGAALAAQRLNPSLCIEVCDAGSLDDKGT